VSSCFCSVRLSSRNNPTLERGLVASPPHQQEGGRISRLGQHSPDFTAVVLPVRCKMRDWLLSDNLPTGVKFAVTTSVPALVSLCRRDDGHWYVTADGRYVVGFSGPAAHELAARQRTELAELMNVDQPDSSENDEKAELFQTDR